MWGRWWPHTAPTIWAEQKPPDPTPHASPEPGGPVSGTKCHPRPMLVPRLLPSVFVPHPVREPPRPKTSTPRTDPVEENRPQGRERRPCQALNGRRSQQARAPALLPRRPCGPGHPRTWGPPPAQQTWPASAAARAPRGCAADHSTAARSCSAHTRTITAFMRAPISTGQPTPKNIKNKISE